MVLILRLDSLRLKSWVGVGVWSPRVSAILEALPIQASILQPGSSCSKMLSDWVSSSFRGMGFSTPDPDP